MDKKLLKIHELEINKMYDMVDNPHPNYLLYYVDSEGNLYNYDTVVKTEHKSYMKYNDALKKEFYEVVSIDYAPNGRRIFHSWIKYTK